MSRPDPDHYAMAFARTAALRATCSRRAVGAAAVRDGHAFVTGYNGAPAGAPHCDHARYERPEDDPDLVQLGGRWTCARAVHAEANLVAYAARRGTALDEATVYCTTHPCAACARLLVSAGVRALVYAERYAGASSAAVVLAESNVDLRWLP